jgi:hypothetical protein
VGLDPSGRDGHRPKSVTRWLRLANMIAACPDVMLLEDANDLAEWRTRPPAYQHDGRTVWMSPVPTFAEWSDDGTIEDGPGSSMAGAVGNLFGMGG